MTSDDKQRAREQWSKDPAGAVYGKAHEVGTREFFDEVERHRHAAPRISASAISGVMPR